MMTQVTESHSKLENMAKFRIMNAKNWLYFWSVQGHKMSLKCCKSRHFLEVSNDVVPNFGSIGKKAVQVPISSIPFFLKHIEEIY